MGLILFGGFATSTGCYYDVQSELYPDHYCDTSNTAYTIAIQPIMQSDCALPGCHVPGGTGTGDFTTYDGLLPQVSNGAVVASIQGTGGISPMPPSGKLSDCDIRKIVLWVNAGAQNN